MVEYNKKTARKAIESLYNGRCTVIEYKDTFDETTRITRKSEVTVIENQPCRLSFVKQNTAVQTDTAAALTQTAKLFTAPEIQIKSGSKIIINQNGRTTAYSASGEPAVYFSHQEIMLEIFEDWT